MLPLCACDDPVRTFPDTRPRDLNELRWTTDSLTDNGSFLQIAALDGQAENSLYAVGTTADSEAVMAQFDGKRWQIVNRYGPPSVLHDITTAGQIDLWAVGGTADSALILRNTGTGWAPIAHPPAPTLLAVDATSGTDVWCSGEHGVILHATLFQWQVYSLGDNLAIESIAAIAPFDVFAIARRTSVTSPFDYPYYLYNFNGAVWSRVDSIPPSGIGLQPRFGTRLYEKLSRIYSLGAGLYFLNLVAWQQQIVTDTLSGMYLQDANNILAVGKSVHHFDGVQWYAFTPPNSSGVRWSDAWMDGTNVFIVGSHGGTTIVEHGE